MPSDESGSVRITVVRGEAGATEIGLDGLRVALADPAARVWIDAAGVPAATIAAIAEALHLHPLVAENVAERNQRAKIEEIDGLFHAVLFALAYEGEVREMEIDFVLAERYLLTVHDGDVRLADAPLLRNGVDRALRHGPDRVFHAVADWMVDGYFPVLDRLADEIDQLQDDVMDRASRWSLERLFVLKRELISLRRATSPARDVFNRLTNRDVGLVRPEQVIYFRDVYDHLIRVTDEVDNYRELVSGTLEVYLSTVNNNLSLIMKRLTGVTVILAGIGAVAGIFGMSEAGAALAGGEAGGFWLVAGGTVALAVVVALVLKRADWI